MYGQSDAGQHAHPQCPAVLGRAGWCEATQSSHCLNACHVLRSLHATISARVGASIPHIRWRINSQLAPDADSTMTSLICAAHTMS